MYIPVTLFLWSEGYANIILRYVPSLNSDGMKTITRTSGSLRHDDEEANATVTTSASPRRVVDVVCRLSVERLGAVVDDDVPSRGNVASDMFV